MRKSIAPLIALAAAIILAGILLLRANVSQQERVDAIPTPTERPSGKLVYAVQHEDRKPTLWFYDLVSSVTTGVGSGYEGAVEGRFNQNSNLCEAAYATAGLFVQCDFDENHVLTLTVSDEQDGGKELQNVVIEPSVLGGKLSPSEGYLVPVAIAEDKSVVYLGRRVEIESWVAGLWKLDVATGKVEEIAYVRDHSLYQYDINPFTKQLAGSTFVPPESLGDAPGVPSSVHVLDLATGIGKELASSYEASSHRVANENPMLSDDGTLFSRHTDDEYGTSVDTVATPRNIAMFQGVAKDWFGDTMVFDRGGNLFLYDLKTNTETQITHETEATVEYFGVVK